MNLSCFFKMTIIVDHIKCFLRLERVLTLFFVFLFLVFQVDDVYSQVDTLEYLTPAQTGFVDNVYLIQSPADLICLSKTSAYWDKLICQVVDVDFEESSWGLCGGVSYSKGDWNMDGDVDGDDDKGFAMIGNGSYFTGTYRGASWNGTTLTLDVDRSVEHLFIDRSVWTGTGMFASTSNAYIKNIHLIDVDINAKAQVGALIGNAQGSTVVEDCSSSGRVVTISREVGGLIGYSKGIELKGSSSYCTVICTLISDVSNANSWSVGGLVGKLDYSGTIINCFASGDVYAENVFNVGGLVGFLVSGTIEGSYSTGFVHGEKSVGGLIGCFSKESTVSNCYSTGAIMADSVAGSFAGSVVLTNSKSSLDSCYATGNVALSGATTSLGAFVGSSSGDIYKDCYYDKETTGAVYYVGNMSDVAGVDPLSTSAFATSSNFNFSASEWSFDNNTYGRPYLAWQNDGSADYNVSNPIPEPIDGGFSQDATYLGTGVLAKGLRYAKIKSLAYDDFSDHAYGWDDVSSASTWPAGDSYTGFEIVKGTEMKYTHPSGISVLGGDDYLVATGTDGSDQSKFVFRELKGLNKTFYVSFLARFSSTVSNSWSFIALGKKDSIDDSGVALGTLGSGSKLGAAFANNGSLISRLGTSSPIGGKTYFVVGKWTCDASGKITSIETWVDPTSPDLEEADYHDSIVGVSDQMSAIDIQSYYSGTSNIDEIRVGRTWSSVVPCEMGWIDVPATSTSGNVFTIEKTGLDSGEFYVQPYIVKADSSREYGDLSSVTFGSVQLSAPDISDVVQPYCGTNYGSVVLSGLPLGIEWKITQNPGNVEYVGSGFSTTISGLSSGTYTFSVEENKYHGLTADYYNSINLSGTPVLTRIDSTVNFDWDRDAPDISVNEDDFSVHWEGRVMPRYTETYTFITSRDDGIRLWVDDSLIINKWSTSAERLDSGTIALEADKRYNIVLEFYEHTGEAVAKLRWHSASQEREIIPKSQLFSDSLTVEYIASSISDEVIIDAPPVTIFSLSGGGSYCLTSDSATLFLSGSEIDVTYQLYVDNTTLVSSIAGTGTPLSFSGISSEGIYTVVAIPDSDLSSCTPMMYGSDTIYDISPSAPLIESITQPISMDSTGSVVLNGLPPLWHLIQIPGDVSYYGEGDSATILNLETGTYSFSVATNYGGNGLLGEYYNNKFDGSSIFTRIDTTINFNLGNESPDDFVKPDGSVVSVGPNNYSVRWSGQVQAVYSELYTFWTYSDDGIRLWVDGTQLVDQWNDHGRTYYSGKIFLEAGEKYNIVLEFYENGGGSVTQLGWTSLSQDSVIIPKSQLYPYENVDDGCFSPFSEEVVITAQCNATDSVTKIGETTATFYGSIFSGWSIVEYGFYYSTDNDESKLINGGTDSCVTAYSDVAIDTSNLIYSCDVTGLTNRSAYYFRSYMKDTSDNYTYGKVVRFLSEKRDFSLALDGDGDFLLIDSTTTRDVINDWGASENTFSVDFWMRNASSDTTKMVIISDTCTDYSTTPSTSLGYMIAYRKGMIYFENRGYLNRTDSVVFDQEWHHIACTYKDRENCIYVDGRLITSKHPVFWFTRPNVNLSCKIGCTNDSKEFTKFYYFNGNIDAMRFWNVALTADQISELCYDNVQSNPSSNTITCIASGRVIPGLTAGNLTASLGFNVMSTQESVGAVPVDIHYPSQESLHYLPFFHADTRLPSDSTSFNIVAVGDAHPSPYLPRVHWRSNPTDSVWMNSSNWGGYAYPGQGVASVDYPDVSSSDLANDSVYCLYTIVDSSAIRPVVTGTPPDVQIFVDKDDRIGTYRVDESDSKLTIIKGFYPRMFDAADIDSKDGAIDIEEGSLEAF